MKAKLVSSGLSVGDMFECELPEDEFYASLDVLTSRRSKLRDSVLYHNNGITRYKPDLESQATAYFEILHPLVDERAYFAFFSGENGEFQRSAVKTGLLDKLQGWIDTNDNECRNTFVSLNQFNAFMKSKDGSLKNFGSIRNEKNLFSLDVLMFDIDSKGENQENLEDQIASLFFEGLKHRELPLPNAFCYTGGGGIHLYYTLQFPLHYRWAKAVKTLKYKLAIEFDKIVQEISEDTGMNYELDTQVFDNSRLDRLPGTMNVKSGKMCEFFSTDIPAYTFQKLLGYENEGEINWNSALKEFQKAFLYDKKKKSKYSLDLSGFKIDPEKKPRKKAASSIKVSKKEYTEGFEKVALNRIESLFKLARNGKSFMNCRERACFILRNSCRQAGLSEQTEEDMLRQLNELFHTPLPENELMRNTQPSQDYKFTNAKIAEYLDIEYESPEWQTMFSGSKIPKNKDELTKREKTTAERFIAIAKLKHEHFISEGGYDLPIKDICSVSGIPVDAVKRINSALNKQKETIAIWKDIDLDPKSESCQENINFVKKWFSDIKLYTKKNENASISKKKAKKEADELEKLRQPMEISVFETVKGKRVPEAVSWFKKRKIILPPLLRDEPVTSYGACIIEQLKGLYKKAKTMHTRSNRTQKGREFMSKVRSLVSAIVFKTKGAVNTLLEHFGINDYFAGKFIFGYWKYSPEYLSEETDRCYSMIDTAEMPAPYQDEMFKTEAFPKLKRSSIYHFDPCIIESYIHELSSNRNEQDRFMEMYTQNIERVRYCRERLKELKREYEKYAREHHYLKCKYLALKAGYYLRAIHKCEERICRTLDEKYSFSSSDVIWLIRKITACLIERKYHKSITIPVYTGIKKSLRNSEYQAAVF